MRIDLRINRSPGRYGDIQLLQILLKNRSQIEADTLHTLAHATLLLTKAATLHTRLSNSQYRKSTTLPSELLEQIVAYLPAEYIDMHMAKTSISWYLATLAATRGHLRDVIRKTKELMCHRDDEIMVLDYDSGRYPPGTEIRWVPIKVIERRRKEVMKWYNVLCRVVGYKL